MDFETWKSQLLSHEADVSAARDEYERLKAKRDKFLLKTVGFEPTSIATLMGTIEMISKVFDMKKGKS